MLHTHLDNAHYAGFWSTLDSDDLYADLTADVSGFEELMRVRIAACVGQATREVSRGLLEGWLSLSGGEFDIFVKEVCGWRVEGAKVVVPLNKENEAKGTVVRENVKFERTFCVCEGQYSRVANGGPEFARMVHRAYEQPA